MPHRLLAFFRQNDPNVLLRNASLRLQSIIPKTKEEQLTIAKLWHFVGSISAEALLLQ